MNQDYGRPQQAGGMPAWGWLIIIPCGCLALLAMGVVIFGAAMFPVFSKARRSARQASCMSNVKQQSLGLIMYVQDYDQRYPPASEWVDLSMPYIKNESVFKCPEVSQPQSDSYGYAFNTALSKLELKKLATPATVSMNYDSTNLSRNASDALSSMPQPPRHPRGNVVGYADGHAKVAGGATASE